MFRSAIAKLTAVYVLLVMILSLTFSFVSYHSATRELGEGLRSQYKAIVESDHDADNTDAADSLSVPELHIREQHIRNDLIYLNCIVLVLSILVGYALARRTLRPIEEAHQSQIRFIAEASHELKTPLTSMKADTESILMQKSVRTKELRLTLESNLRDIERLEALTRHLLDMGRFRSGTKPLSEEINVKLLVADVTELLRAKNIDKKIMVQCSIEVSVIWADPIVIRQLLVILVDNAFKYSYADETISVKVKSENGNVILEVADKGIGIDETDLPHIFEHFYRSSHTALSKEASGYGLGLPLAHDIVTMYKGHISVESNLRRGTTVTVRLPLKFSSNRT